MKAQSLQPWSASRIRPPLSDGQLCKPHGATVSCNVVLSSLPSVYSCSGARAVGRMSNTNGISSYEHILWRMERTVPPQYSAALSRCPEKSMAILPSSKRQNSGMSICATTVPQPKPLLIAADCSWQEIEIPRYTSEKGLQTRRNIPKYALQSSVCLEYELSAALPFNGV